jgi:Domain of unknown function (DUF4352)
LHVPRIPHRTSAHRVRPCSGAGRLLQHRQPHTANPPDTTADSGLSEADTTTETLPETTDTTQAEELDLKVGDTAEYTDGVRMTVLGLQRDVQPSYRELLTNPKAKVLAVTVKIVNGSSESFDLSVTLNLVYGQDGREAEAFFDSAKGISGIDSPSRLRPKRAVTGKFAFEVPSSNVKELAFEGAPGFDYDAQQWTA